MKKIILLILLIASFFQKSNAQFTTPMPDTSANWTITTSFYDIGTFTYYYSHDRSILVGDTIINGFTYYQISQANDINDTTDYSFPLYRIDSNKVYFLVNDSTERLEYDYGMQIGDSILLSDDFTYGILQNIDTLTIFSGHGITRFNFGNGTDWYYGIGSSAGFENYEYCECAIDLSSFYYKGECYIFSGNSNICDANLNSVESMNENSNLFSLFPNPSSNYFTIQISELIENAVIEMYNSIGELVYSQKMESENHMVFTHNFDDGIYFVNVYSNNESYSQKIVIYK